MELSLPHRHIPVRSEKEKFLVLLFDDLWVRYRSRMDYVRQYEEIIRTHRAKFVNDHIAFRSFAWQNPAAGRFVISRIFEALGYVAAATYEFPDQHLSSVHYQHPNSQFPKLFITQLKSWELTLKSQKIIARYLKYHRPLLNEKSLSQLWNFEQLSVGKQQNLLRLVQNLFNQLPWEVPQKKDVLQLNEESQFAAWVLVNGYEVNHFTASVDSHGVAPLDDIEKVAVEMKNAGIPMKPEIEGERGSKLRQTSTQAVIIDTPIKVGKKITTIPWSYAYFEIAQRLFLPNPVTGKLERFEGFLGGQATNLFKMTSVKM